MSVLYELIEDDFTVIPKGRGGRWFTTTEHDSLIIDEQSEAFFWNSKDLVGDAYTWLTKVKGLNHKVAKDKISLLEGKPQIFTEITHREQEIVIYPKLVEIFWERGKEEREYWYKRGLSDKTIDQFQLGYNDGWYSIPIYEYGNFINFQMRRDLPEKRIKFWYGNFSPTIFNKEILRISNYVIIAESPTDVMLLTQYGYPAVCSTNGAGNWQKEWFKYFIKQEEIFVVYDNDKAGYQGIKNVAKHLGEERCKTYFFSGYPTKYDLGDWLKNNDPWFLKEFLQEHSQKSYMWTVFEEGSDG